VLPTARGADRARRLRGLKGSTRFAENSFESGTAVTAAFTLRLSEATLEALDRLAEKTERSRSWLAAKAIEDYIALNAWQIGRIEAGIAAADRGDFATDDDVARMVGKYSAKD
jgi:predicted transcriptional regulator